MTTGPAAPNAIDFARRLRHAGEALEYLTLSLPLALVCALTTAVLVLGAALGAIWIGLPLVLAAVAVCARLAEVERRQANRLLDAHIPPLPAPTQHTGTLWRRALASLTDREGWRVLVFVAIKAPLSIAALLAGLLPVAVTAWLLVFGVRGIGGLGDRFYIGPWTLGPLTGLVLCALALAAGILAIAALGGLRSLLGSLARTLLAPGRAAARPGPRDARREPRRPHPLGRLLAARPQALRRRARATSCACPSPAPAARGPPVERDGRRVAAIIHDAELATGPELVNAAAAGAALAIDNERLKANLRARVEELRVSRIRIVEAQDHARSAHRARPPRRRPAAARLALARPAPAQEQAQRQRGGRRDRRRAVGEARDRAGRAARARPRHPPGDPHRARARARRRGARPARAGAGRGEHLDPPAPDAGDRVRRLLRGRRGADQRRQVRAGRERRRRPQPRAATR